MSNARSFLFPFKYSHRVAYVVEFSHLKIRLYAQRALVRQHNIVTEGGGGTTEEPDEAFPPFELTSPYTYSDLWDDDELCCKIQTIQHSDIMYIFNANHPIMLLKRYANDDWRLEELELKNGPFLSMNTTETMISVTEKTGTTQLTASTDIFSQTDVGRLVRLRVLDDETKPWSAGTNVSALEIRTSDNKYYMAVGAGQTGAIKPVHSEGTRSDGNVSWQYVHDGIGLVKISEFTDAQHVAAEVISRLPDALEKGTVCWELGMIHQGSSYPISGAFFRNRFAFLVNSETGPNVCLSYSGDYNNFADMDCGEATAETAITVPVLSTEFNEGKWIYARDALFVGTGAAEFYIDAITASQAMAADNIRISQISTVGSKAIMPVAIGAHVLFVDRYGLSLRDLMYNYYNDGYDQTDVSILGKHLFQSRIVAMVYQEVPDKVLWCLIGDGSLAAVTFSSEQEVAAFSRHDVSGTVESLTVIPNLDDNRDELWLEVRRVVNNAYLRTVEWMDSGMPQALPVATTDFSDWQTKNAQEARYIRQNSVYLDATVVFDKTNDTETSVLSGLEHLEGKEVMLFGDGAVLGTGVVYNGQIEAPKNISHLIVGLAVCSQFIPQNVYIPNEFGSGIGQKQRINHVLLSLYLSGGGQIGEDEKSLTDILYRDTDALMNEPEELFSGNKEILFDGSTTQKEQAANLLIQTTSPLPLNILAIVPYLDVAE